MAPKKIERQACLVFSRVNGWLTSINTWNPGKKAEWDDRKEYDKTLGEINS